ncbi:hypothetical protein R3P38DRAFT_3204577 [Favolaschia claudopus]|uniref:Uncharacterized protein n=1 Tax=Favolaschia claudopus TaxID=2862362 RepID=A0AAW0APT6_9AGAR
MLYWHWYCKTTTAIQPFVNLHLMRGFQLYLFQPDADLRSYPAFPTLCDDTSAPTPTRSGSRPCTHSPYCHNPLSSSAHDMFFIYLPRHISSLTSPTYVSFRLRTALLRVLRTLFVTSLDGHPLLACEAYPRLAYGALTHVGAHPSSSPHLTPLGFASCDDLHLTLRDSALFLPHATASSSSLTRRRPHPPARDGVLILLHATASSSSPRAAAHPPPAYSIFCMSATRLFLQRATLPAPSILRTSHDLVYCATTRFEAVLT